MGLCYLGLAEHNGANANLALAVTAFQEALGFLPASEFSAARAGVQSRLGDAHRLRFLAESEPQYADEATEAYQAALGLYTAAGNAVAQAQKRSTASATSTATSMRRTTRIWSERCSFTNRRGGP